MIDRALFEYETKRSGHTMAEVAEAMGLSASGLSRRLTGETEFRRVEMEAWMQLTGVKDAGPVFFPPDAAQTEQEEGRA